MSDKYKPWNDRKPKKRQYSDDVYRGRKGKDRSSKDRQNKDWRSNISYEPK